MAGKKPWGLPMNFRLRYIPTAWVGKPGASTSELFIYSDDPSYLHEKGMKLKAKGCGSILIETRPKGATE